MIYEVLLTHVGRQGIDAAHLLARHTQLIDDTIDNTSHSH